MTPHTITDEQRAARRERDRQLVQSAIEQLRSSAGWQAWLTARGRFHHYSVHNQLLIALQHQNATHVAGFKAWLSLGYCVRHGEHAIRIWAPCQPSARQLDRWQAAGGDPSERPRPSFRLAAVFAQDQVEALPPPATPAPLDPPSQPIDGVSLAATLTPLTRLAGEIGYNVEFDALGGPDGICEPHARRVRIERTLTPNGQVAAMIHELAHAPARVDRRDDDPTLSYAQEELVAESIAWSVCRSLGFDTSPNSIPYLTAWSTNTDLNVLERTARLVDRIANRVEGAIATPAIDGEILPTAVAMRGVASCSG